MIEQPETEPKWLQPDKNGIVTLPMMNPFTKRWSGFINGKFVDITEEYEEYAKEHNFWGKYDQPPY